MHAGLWADKTTLGGGQIEVTIFEGEGEGLLRDISSPVAEQAVEQMTAFIHQHIG